MPEKMRVLMMPDFRPDNPYQTLLSEALSAQATAVDFPRGYRRVFPLRRALQQSEQGYSLLHLHWTTPYLKGTSFGVRLFYAIKFLIDVCLVKLANVRVVWTVHNLISHEAQFPQLELWFYRLLAQLADGVVVHHLQAKQAVTGRYWVSADKVQVIPHGHYREAYGQKIDQKTAREKLGLPLHGKIYLNFGMLRPYKGIESLLSVWSQDWAKAAATLLIAGKPMDEAYQNKLTTLASGLDNVVLHLSYIEEADIALYFSAADVAVLPFEKILTSGSLLLAMSYGLPVVAPRLGSIPETLKGADELLYSPKENNASSSLKRVQTGLATALQKSRSDLQKQREQVVAACDQLGWASIAAKTHRLYRLARNKQIGSGKEPVLDANRPDLTH